MQKNAWVGRKDMRKNMRRGVKEGEGYSFPRFVTPGVRIQLILGLRLFLILELSHLVLRMDYHLALF